jgi:hypothetical protein
VSEDRRYPEFIAPHPLVHLNGSGTKNLLEERKYMYEALRAADTVLAAATPHGRDYYPLGDAVYAAARAAHEARRVAIDEMIKAIIAEVEAIEKGKVK